MKKTEREEYDTDLMRGLLKRCLSAVMFWVVLIMLVLMFASCKTHTVVVETVRTDTTYITKQQRDSIWLHDSIYMHEYQKGDTVFMQRDRWRTKYVEKSVHDTTYISTHDTIPQPVPVYVEVEKKLNWFQKIIMHAGGFAFSILFLYICVQIWKLYKRRF